MLREVMEGQIRDVGTNGRESAAFQVAKESLGPMRSSAIYVANRASRGRFFPETSVYFDGPKEREKQEVSWRQLPGVLDNIDSRITSDSKRPENFAGKKLASDWQSARDSLRELLIQHSGEGTKLTDYVFSVKGSHTLFYEAVRDGKGFIYPLTVGGGISNEEMQQSIARQVSEPAACAELGRERSDAGSIEENIAVENAVELIQDRMMLVPGTGSLRRISSVTNEFAPVRHEGFEHDGKMIRTLRRMGAYSVGELQQAQLFLIQKTLHFDEEEGEVGFDQDVADVWTSMWMKAHPDREEPEAAEELGKYARERIYFEFVSQWLRENPQLAARFRNSHEYKKHHEQFRDMNLSASGQTETQTAVAMLANYYLYRFEGANTPQESPSQRQLALIEGFHNDVASFLDAEGELALDLPKVPQINSAGCQSEELRNVAERLSNLPYKQAVFDNAEKVQVIDQARSAMQRIEHEISRHRATQPIADLLGLIHGDDTKLIHALVANIGLARVPGEKRFTASSWFPCAEGYLPDGAGIFPFEQERGASSIEDAIRYVFNGQAMDMGDGGFSDSAYESQVARISEVGAQVIDFLRTDQRVPEKVRQFAETIASPKELKVKLLEVFSHIGEQDPLVVNRFFPEGFETFYTMTLHRYATDFLRGVESQLVKSTKPAKERARRRFKGQWKDYDFSTVDEDTLQSAIDKTLARGEHRINKLNHEEGEKKTTLKDWQEYFEKVFGWDTHEMKFLRWESFWDVWNSLGPAWDCICFSRKPIFNTDTYQQF
jgi:hypothetical protein